MTEHELTVLVTAGERTGIAVHPENSGGNFRALLSNKELPGVFTLLRAVHSFQVPEAGNIWGLNLRWSFRCRTSSVDGKRLAAPRAVLAIQCAVFECRLEMGRVAFRIRV